MWNSTCLIDRAARNDKSLVIRANLISAFLLLFAFTLPLIVTDAVSAQGSPGFPLLDGPYLGQEPPGLTPVVFAPDIVSTGSDEVNSVFSPDGKEFYFAKFAGGRGYTIMVMRWEANGWSAPRVAPFSGDYSEVDVFITHDGRRLFFISKRPLTPGGQRSPGYQIWVMERENGGWGQPVHLSRTINMGTRQLFPTAAAGGNLYFNSTVGGSGRGDFFRSVYRNGEYGPPESLGDSINTLYDETDILVAPDESFLIFTSVERPGGFGNGDLYVSFRDGDGCWTAAQNMGDDINTASSEFSPALSPDGRYLFFTSRRSGSDDIYWVDAQIIERHRFD